MTVFDLNSGRRIYPGYNGIDDRRGGREWDRRPDGTYMGHGGYPAPQYPVPPYAHYGMGDRMRELEQRERALAERERELEQRERRQMEELENRRMGYESYPTDYSGGNRYYGGGPEMTGGWRPSYY